LPDWRGKDEESVSGAAAKQEAEAVRRRILDELRDGTLEPGQRLGSERALAERFGVSRSTLRLALDALERGGTIRRVPGRGGGTFLHQSRIERDLSGIAGLPEYLRRQGFVAGTQVISAAVDGLPFEFSVDLFRGVRTRIVVRSSGALREVSHSEDGDAVEVHSS
jgi:DNA-binding transcriptional MocR family regulator